VTALAFNIEAKRVQIATDSLAFGLNGNPSFMTAKVFWLSQPWIAVTGRGDFDCLKASVQALSTLPPGAMSNAIHQRMGPLAADFRDRMLRHDLVDTSIAVFFFDILLNRYCCWWYRSPKNGGFTPYFDDRLAFMPYLFERDIEHDVAALGFGLAAAAWIRQAKEIDDTLPDEQRSHIGGPIRLHTLESGYRHRAEILDDLG
jgi:hypothetical protein